MSNSIIYLKSSTLRGNVSLTKLQQEIEASNITKTVMNMVDIGNEFAVVFNEELSNEERDTLDSLISSHNFLSPADEVKIVVSNAITFGHNLIVDFASENVLMGITQAGKTKDVADYLADLMRYAQTGSLYEVINEVDRLIATGLPVDLEPFITQARMEAFKQQVVDYLT
jgi:hypothetical protein